MDDANIQVQIRESLTPEDHVNRLHELLGIVLKVFAQHDIFYMAMSGTLLGIVRNNDYIPWDDDVDLAVNFSDYDKLMKLNEDLQYYGIEIVVPEYRWNTGQKWNILKVKFVGEKNVFIDLFPFHYKGDDYCMPPGGLVDPFWYNQAMNPSWYDRNVFKKSEIQPIQMMKLRDLDVACPKNPYGFIKRSYGEDAVETCVVSHHHFSSNYIFSGIIKKIKIWLKLGIYGKQFECNLATGITPPTPSSNILFWMFLFIVVVLIVLALRKYR